MPAILVNYRFDPVWLKEYNFDVTLYDRSDDGVERVFDAATYRTKNVGDVDYDKLGYLVEHYDDLPEIFLWGKSNLLKYCDKDYLDKMLSKGEFAPLLKLDHRTYSDKYGVVCKYEHGIYWERADDWLFHNQDLANRGWFSSWTDWCREFALPAESYIPFAPGGSYLLTRERVHRYSRDFYEKMRDTLPYAMHPMEAHLAERSYFLLWK